MPKNWCNFTALILRQCNSLHFSLCFLRAGRGNSADFVISPSRISKHRSTFCLSTFLSIDKFHPRGVTHKNKLVFITVAKNKTAQYRYCRTQKTNNNMNKGIEKSCKIITAPSSIRAILFLSIATICNVSKRAENSSDKRSRICRRAISKLQRITNNKSRIYRFR